MNLTKKNAARLASISALGAGALGVATGTAEAAIHYTAVDDKVGFGAGYGASATLTLTGPANVRVFRSTVVGSSTPIGYRAWSVLLAGTSVESRNATAGQTWVQGKAGGLAGTQEIVGERSANSSTGSAGRTSSTNGTFYRLFRFQKGGSGAWYYGWVELSQTVTGTVGPEVTVLGYAWDDTGVVIRAGQTTSFEKDTPLPSTLWLAGLGALALGATGLRRWRNARTAA
jgi:hypothetical protein